MLANTGELEGLSGKTLDQIERSECGLSSDVIASIQLLLLLLPLPPRLPPRAPAQPLACLPASKQSLSIAQKQRSIGKSDPVGYVDSASSDYRIGKRQRVMSSK